MWAKTSYQLQKNIALLGTCLTFAVLMLGAYTRLSDAGLGCPDWPGCYGKLIVPDNPSLSDYPMLDARKAWIEMIHRYMAGLLGLIITGLSFLAIVNKKQVNQPILLPIILFVLVIFQGLLGMWTVTLKLLPIVVMAHLLGGMTLLTGLWYLTLRLQTPPSVFLFKKQALTRMLNLSLLILVLQLALGGWTSANYAALVCPDFPFCQGTDFNTLPTFYLSEAFLTVKPALSLEARMTVHVMHRIGAVITTLILSYLAFMLYKNNLKPYSMGLMMLLCLQLALGISNVVYLLPIPIALVHHGVAALLLLLLVTLHFKVHHERLL